MKLQAMIRNVCANHTGARDARGERGERARGGSRVRLFTGLLSDLLVRLGEDSDEHVDEDEEDEYDK